jgi:hypothetical protein
MFITNEELKATKEYIGYKKRDVLRRKGGSNLDYIRDLQTLIILENAVDEKTSESQE